MYRVKERDLGRVSEGKRQRELGRESGREIDRARDRQRMTSERVRER